ncbi:putative mitochondrial protein-like [Abeliophyllum distichum]|uniref:Mitochondrial protein-like n=1 Tax=Abeliophyllum distichum TaxID=126358 RepID=A0ABD1VYL6_9LAMI
MHTPEWNSSGGRLYGSSYGLKQAPCIWFEKFSTVVASIGFASNHHDSTLFSRCTSYGCILLLLYINDMIITGDVVDDIATLKSDLARRYSPSDSIPLPDIICTALSLEVSSISPSSNLILLILFTLLVSLSLLRLSFTKELLFILCALYVVLAFRISYFYRPLPWSFAYTLMLIGPATQLIVGLLLVFVYFWVTHLSLERVRSRLLFFY